MKKMLGFMIVISIVAQMMVCPISANAASPLWDWTFNNMAPDAGIVMVDGDYAAHLKIDKSTYDNKPGMLEYKLKEAWKDGTYTIEFYIKVLTEGGAIPPVGAEVNYHYETRPGIGGVWKNASDNSLDMTVGEPDANGWRKVSYANLQGYTQSQDGSESKSFRFNCDGSGAHDFYIDDLVIYNNDDPNKKNIIEAGNFEIPGETDANPVAWNFKDPGTNINDDEIRMVTTKESHSGDKSMYLEIVGRTDQETTMYVPNTEIYYPADSAEKRYSVEFYVKNMTTQVPRIAVMLNNDWKKRARIENCGIYIESGMPEMKIEEADANGWQRVSYDGLQGPSGHVNGKTDHMFWFMLHVGKNTQRHAFYIDDVILYETGDTSKTNLLSNGGFEAVKTERDAYEPKNVMITNKKDTTSGNKYQQMISWRNPVSPALSGVSLYDVTSGAESLISDSISIGADALVNVVSDVTDVNEGTKKLYKAFFEFTDGETRTIFIGDAVTKPENGSNNYKVGDWGFYGAYWLANGNPPAEVVVDNNVGRTAAPSLKLVSNTHTAKDGYNSELHLYTPENLVEGKTYRFTMYVKGNNVGFSSIRVGEFKNNISANLLVANQNKNYTEWKKVTCDYTATADSKNYGVNIITDYATEDLWIDDVSMYLLENGTETGENLFSQSGSADGIAQPKEVTGAEITNKNETSRIAWTAGADAKYIALYEGESLRGFVPADYGYLDVTNLTNGKDYNYTLKAVSGDRRESATGFNVTLSPEPEKMVITDFESSKSGNTVTVSVDVKNNGKGDNVTAELILALYDGDVLKDVVVSGAVAVPQTGYYEDPVNISKSITVSDGYKLRAYLWDSLAGMTPLKDAEFINYQ